ncbi:hypothetical protein LTR37_001542 [Vermiconidia calcicola]|uniref:Uncharacterized protein n=1 Tax=Vermiconidia calcicola TaxID=1690605 RepID=A0ACC3NVI8_9PEZI|nr:hypothetical protein LTR37_001542 [Vermiconidia calcicola]
MTSRSTVHGTSRASTGGLVNEWDGVPPIVNRSVTVVPGVTSASIFGGMFVNIASRSNLEISTSTLTSRSEAPTPTCLLHNMAQQTRLSARVTAARAEKERMQLAREAAEEEQRPLPELPLELLATICEMALYTTAVVRFRVACSEPAPMINQLSENPTLPPAQSIQFRPIEMGDTHEVLKTFTMGDTHGVPKTFTSLCLVNREMRSSAERAFYKNQVFCIWDGGGLPVYANTSKLQVSARAFDLMKKVLIETCVPWSPIYTSIEFDVNGQGISSVPRYSSSWMLAYNDKPADSTKVFQQYVLPEITRLGGQEHGMRLMQKLVRFLIVKSLSPEYRKAMQDCDEES